MQVSAALFSKLPAIVVNAPVPLISPYIPQQILIIHNGDQITQEKFLGDLYKIVANLPEAGFALNLCEDRYYFLLGFCALLVKRAVNLLPPNRQALTLFELAQDYPACYCLIDRQQDCHLPSINLIDLLDKPVAELENSILPVIPAQQIAAIAFTSGSTGKPKANPKCWGTLAATARLLGQRLCSDLIAPVIVGTVPPQHMYGLETTLLIPLQSGAIMHSDKPFYPADVQQLLSQLPFPRILVTTPIHLRALVNSELPMPELAGIISATAPLDQSLAHAAEVCFNSSLWEIYGCTEAGSMATRRSTSTDEWQLLEDFKLALTDEGASASAPHLPGNAPIQDQLTLLAEDKFLLGGRNADMINVAGKRDSLANLTLQLLRVDGVLDGVIFLPPNSGQTEVRPAALVVSDRMEKEILADLALRVDASFLPRPLRKVAALPRNETGKLTAAMLNQLWKEIHE